MKIRPILQCLLAAVLACWCASAHAEQHTIPLFVGASPGGDPQGMLRLANDAEAAANVSIQAIDDTGLIVGLTTLTLDASAAMELTATDLESGNAAKGLAAGIGPLGGNVRLVVDSDAPVVPSAYVRGAGGTLAPMNATVRGTADADRAADAGAGQTFAAGDTGTAAHLYDVTLFHPAGNATQPSRLRLINPGDDAARVTVEARDDFGTPASGGAVQLSLPAGSARTLTAQQLEAGDTGADAAFTGRLGAGVGNWRLAVSADRPIDVIHVTVGPAGDWRNLSTSAIQGWAPADAAAFEARFMDRAIVDRDGSGDRIELRVLAEGQIRESTFADGVEITGYQGLYAYERTGRDAARVTLLGERSEWYLHFASPDSGWRARAAVEAGSGEAWSAGGWRASAPGGSTLDLGAGPDSRAYTAGAPIDAEVLPEAAGGAGDLIYSLSPEVPGLSFDPRTRRLSGMPARAGDYTMTYRVRDETGDTDWRRFRIAVRAAGDGVSVHEAGDTLADLPAGAWEPDRLSGGAVRTSPQDGGPAAIELDHLEYFEIGGRRYTCQSAGGCLVRNRSVAEGSVLDAPLGGGAGDDHGDDRASATPVAAGSDTPGRLDSGDADWFRIDVDGPGRLEVYTSGGVDTTGRLEDAAGGIVGSSDDFGADINFRIAATVAAGAYYVAVRGFGPGDTGAYTLHAHLTAADPRPSGDCRVGLSVSPGESCLDRAANTTFTVLSDGRAQYGFISAGSGITVNNFKATHQGGGVWRIDEVGGGGDDGSGTGGGTGGDHGDDAASATTVAAASSDTPGALTSEDSDWFRIEVDAPGRLAVYTTGSVDTFGRLVDAGGAALDSDDNGGTSTNFRISQEVEAGTYFVRVAGRFRYTTGDYTLHVRLDSPSLATPVEVDSDTQGTLTYDEAHWFRIEVGAPGTLAVYTTGSIDTEGRLVDAGGATLDSDDNGGTSTNFRISQEVEAGTYFVRVAGRFRYTTGDYTLHVRFSEPDTSPSFAGAQPPGDRSYTEGTPINAFTLPAASGGDGILTYSLSPNVPGLTFDAAARQLSGTPTRAGDYSMTYTVRDGDDDTESLSFTITVNEADTAPGFSGAQANLSFTEDSPISAVTLPAASGGNDTLTYSLSPSVPGLTFDAAARQLSGTPTRAGDYSMTYTVRDSDDDTDSLSFTITVNEADTAPGFSGSQANLSFTEDSPISAVTLPAASGGNGTLTYSLSPSVPGLTFDAAARRLSGTPTRAGDYSMTYTVRDGDDDTDSLSFTITVNEADTAPGFAGSQANLSYTEDSPISAVTLPAATGGNGSLTYALSPSVPGLTFTAATRRLSGTPTRAGDYSMTYTVRDGDDDTDTLSFTITVNEVDTSPGFSGSQADLSLTEGSAISAVTLPAASGGNGSLTYSLSPSVPGLTFTAATRRLSGRPTRAGTYRMTYTATDADGDSDSLRFTIQVFELDDIIELENGTCDGSRTTSFSFWTVTMRGTLRARVDIPTHFYVVGYVDDWRIGNERMDPMNAGDTQDFSITGTSASTGSSFNCRVTIGDSPSSSQGPGPVPESTRGAGGPSGEEVPDDNATNLVGSTLLRLGPGAVTAISNEGPAPRATAVPGVD